MILITDKVSSSRLKPRQRPHHISPCAMSDLLHPGILSVAALLLLLPALRRRGLPPVTQVRWAQARRVRRQAQPLEQRALPQLPQEQALVRQRRAPFGNLPERLLWTGCMQASRPSFRSSLMCELKGSVCCGHRLLTGCLYSSARNTRMSVGSMPKAPALGLDSRSAMPACASPPPRSEV